jgi:hypothetical protein
MFRRSLSLALAVMLFQSGIMPLFAAPQPAEEARQSAKARAAVAKRGVGEGAKIKLHDGTEVKGQISQIGAESFAVREEKSGATRTLAYREASDVKSKGLSTGAKIGIGMAIAVGSGRPDAGCKRQFRGFAGEVNQRRKEAKGAWLAGRLSTPSIKHRHSNGQNNESACVCKKSLGRRFAALLG